MSKTFRDRVQQKIVKIIPEPPQDDPPKGTHDAANCTNTVGWACDADNYNATVQVHFYADGPAGGGGTFLGSFPADKARGTGVGNACGGNPNHGFNVPIDDFIVDLKDGQPHNIYA